MAKLLLQEILDNIVKDIIAPKLKKIGFRKSNRNFYKEVSNYGLCFNIQSSLYNNEQEIRFTFNTGIFVPSLYSLYFNYDTPKFPKEYECFNRKRIGELLGGSDYWYSITSNTNIDEVKQHIAAHLDNYIIPYFECFTDDEDIFALYNSKTFLKAPYDYAFLAGFLIQFGDKKDGETLLKELYIKSNSEVYKETLRKYATKLNIAL